MDKAEKKPAGVTFDVIDGVAGKSLVVKEGEHCGHRISGPKAWGGGTLFKSFRVTGRRDLEAIKTQVDAALAQTEEP